MAVQFVACDGLYISDCLCLVHQPAIVLHNVQCVTNIILLHVSAPRFHPQSVRQITAVPAQHANLVHIAHTAVIPTVQVYI